MNISGISGLGAVQSNGGQKSNSSEISQLEAKLENAKREKDNLEKSLSFGGGDVNKIKAEIAKKKQEIADLEKKLQEKKSESQEDDNSVQNNQGKNDKVSNNSNEQKEGNSASKGPNSSLTLTGTGNVIDEYA